MNNIGIGIFCFGEDYYYKGTDDKINHFIGQDLHCYILTDNVEYFKNRYASNIVHPIFYNRTFKSYHDKMILPKYILKNHDYCLLIDADTHVTDYSFIDKLKTFEFKNGISYVDTLLNHKAKREFVKDLITDSTEWSSYKTYAEKIYPPFFNFETIWEYFLIINKIGFNESQFYNQYDKLQIAKEFCDLTMNKQINGAGEGISINIASKLSNTQIQKDLDLFELVKDKMISVSRRHTPRELWPNWMK